LASSPGVYHRPPDDWESWAFQIRNWLLIQA
jgi:hypothetical protein